ncbi:MAG: hypothetical protein LBT31_00710 [Synergistaceae bacterium]|nr:hypothetical protein [Synergistaceae bacterium]
MKIVQKRASHVISILCLSLVLAGSAAASENMEYFLERLDEELARLESGGDFYFYASGEDRYADVNEKEGVITHSEHGVVVANGKKNHSWAYFFPIPEGENNYANWSSRLEVMSIEGEAWAGLAMQNNAVGLSFSVNSFGRGALKVILVNKSAHVVDEFFINPQSHWATGTPLNLGLDYDVITGELTALIDDVPVRTVKLPYYGIPAIASLKGFAMETTNYAAAGGSVTYGTFMARGSR